tara:strand:+ start:294 stop:491 length:198 start_codon:yes stop_codon:yes gene_type:complete
MALSDRVKEILLNEFTEEVTLTCDALDLNLWIKPGTDLDDTFEAWCLDGREFIEVKGWLFSVIEE